MNIISNSYIGDAGRVIKNSLYEFNTDLFCSSDFNINHFCKFHFDAYKVYEDYEQVALREKYTFCIEQYNQREKEADYGNPFYFKQKLCKSSSKEDLLSELVKIGLPAMYMLSFSLARKCSIDLYFGDYKGAIQAGIFAAAFGCYATYCLKTLYDQDPMNCISPLVTTAIVAYATLINPPPRPLIETPIPLDGVGVRYTPQHHRHNHYRNAVRA